METPTYTKMDPIERAAWVAALRSGAYRQARHVLYDTLDNSFCCLGVRLKVLGYVPHATGESSHCFKDLGDWRLSCKLDLDAIDVLTVMNDTGKTFEEIAAWIEKHL